MIQAPFAGWQKKKVVLLKRLLKIGILKCMLNSMHGYNTTNKKISGY
jgi:hypothetical protein